MIMAADWIKIQHGLIDKPEVMQMSEELDISPYEVVGHLVAVWFWVDMNLSPNCPEVKGTKKGLDRVAGRDGFAEAMIRAGWLRLENGVLSVPNYDSHLSKSGKARAEEQKKKAKQREKRTKDHAEDVPKMSPNLGDKTGTEMGTREEKRREEYLEREGASAGEEEKLESVSKRSDGFRKTWSRWKRHMIENGKPITGPSEEQNLYNLATAFREESDQIACIEYSIANNYKSLILTGEHKRQREGPQQRRNGKPVLSNDELFSEIGKV